MLLCIELTRLRKLLFQRLRLLLSHRKRLGLTRNKGRLQVLVGAANSVQENLKLWLNFYKSGEAEKYGYDCKSGIASTTKLLALCANMKKQLEEAKKAMIAFENAL